MGVAEGALDDWTGNQKDKDKEGTFPIMRFEVQSRAILNINKFQLKE